MRKRQYTHEDFINRVSDTFGNKYTILSKYTGMDNKVLIRHNSCNYQWEIRASSIFRGTHCPSCSGRLKLTTNLFKERVFILTNGEYAVLGEYINTDTKILMRHIKCGHEYEIKPHNFISGGKRCPNCDRRKKYTDKEFKDIITNLVGDEYFVNDIYSGMATKLIFNHSVCGSSFITTPGHFIYEDQRCPNCNNNLSKGEKKIFNYFLDNGLKFESQYTTYETKNLRFDFAILDNENNMVCLIEYDGEQHYEPIEYFGGEDEFNKIRLRDSIKNDYCIEYNIPLLRIPYWEYKNLDIILEGIENYIKSNQLLMI